MDQPLIVSICLSCLCRFGAWQAGHSVFYAEVL